MIKLTPTSPLLIVSCKNEKAAPTSRWNGNDLRWPKSKIGNHTIRSRCNKNERRQAVICLLADGSWVIICYKAAPHCPHAPLSLEQCERGTGTLRNEFRKREVDKHTYITLTPMQLVCRLWHPCARMDLCVYVFGYTEGTISEIAF